MITTYKLTMRDEFGNNENDDYRVDEEGFCDRSPNTGVCRTAVAYLLGLDEDSDELPVDLTVTVSNSVRLDGGVKVQYCRSEGEPSYFLIGRNIKHSGYIYKETRRILEEHGIDDGPVWVRANVEV